MVASAAVTQLRVPQLPIKQRKLANGLTVVSLKRQFQPDASRSTSGTTSAQRTIRAGRNGFAHLFEHIMFKSTKNMPAENMDRLTEDVGGFNNASTWDDFTNYYEVVPSNHLETLLWAEAERMANLTVDDANFKSERAVVEEEYRQSYLARPYGMFNYYLQSLSYSASPYHRTTIGTLEDLDTATVKDVQDFHTTFYRPDNAYLIVVGDFDQTQMDAWIDKYFEQDRSSVDAGAARIYARTAADKGAEIRKGTAECPVPGNGYHVSRAKVRRSRYSRPPGCGKDPLRRRELAAVSVARLQTADRSRGIVRGPGPLGGRLACFPRDRGGG